MNSRIEIQRPRFEAIFPSRFNGGKARVYRGEHVAQFADGIGAREERAQLVLDSRERSRVDSRQASGGRSLRLGAPDDSLHGEKSARLRGHFREVKLPHAARKGDTSP